MRVVGAFLLELGPIPEGTFVPLSEITVLFGPNAAGKSSVLEGLASLAGLNSESLVDC